MCSPPPVLLPLASHCMVLTDLINPVINHLKNMSSYKYHTVWTLQVLLNIITQVSTWQTTTIWCTPLFYIQSLAGTSQIPKSSVSSTDWCALGSSGVCLILKEVQKHYCVLCLMKENLGVYFILKVLDLSKEVHVYLPVVRPLSLISTGVLMFHIH